MDNQFKASGVAFTIYGACTVLAFLLTYIFGITLFSGVQSLPISFFLLIYASLAINFLSLLCGLYLLKQNEAVHKIALPVSILILFSVPFGTIVGSIYLMQRFKNT
ncbi:hypothetical protein EXT46_05715 [Pseudoalteromonas sp. CO325X]|uniref:hypothetical protein n=1 Tax=Pseudoalteromonas sp. CO325X TaxID=1777262 RepID=UPI001023E414|nr:hypothetical protein [Pseudoalteromonas sp. CO325X]RZF82948.1 hypothetical protein EXT46_05715 [Pseudoalteromonas sp. CO325X]